MGLAAASPAPVRAAQPPQQPVVREPLPEPEPDDPEADEVQIRTVPEPVEPPPAREEPPALPMPRRTPPPGPASDLVLTSPGGLEIATPTTPVQAFSARPIDGSERQFVGERYSFSLRDADLVETLRSFATMSGLNMVIQPGVSGTVTMELNDVPWDQAFEQVLKINGLSYEVEGNIMRIAPIGTLQAEAQGRQELERAQALSIPLRTVMRRLSYASAAQLEGLLRRGILSQRGSVIVDPRTNTLIIRELPNYLDTVIAVIENIDIAEPLVMIEARIVETRKNFTRTLGIEWSFGGVSAPEFGNTTGLQFPNQGTVDGGVNLLTGGNNAFIDLTLGNVLNTFNLDLALQAAENEGLVNILSSPKVQALNNQQASIQSGFQIPIQTVANNTVSVQFVNATLKLDVRPQVTAEGTVLMDINIQKRNPEFGLTIAGSANAPISTKEAQTRVMVRDGGTTVIGGIYEVSSNQGEDRVPGLANIPIIGHLFKNRRREDQNNELLIFITPRVIRF
jgi:type IV pilus assembly protein PilQ